ncbi:hypothetical protein A2U01_0006494 [Trifolium medium]|uniref:Uncharacterized protein n=1 Tax=Trifolium medium TaxID=97028 RepID=A0A392MEW6_9FABA|nr:hypothetical protein [Trifolium medium]
MLALVERDPTLYFNIKSLFNKLQTPRTSEALFLLVTQAENILEQYAKNFHHLASNTQLRNTQISIQLDRFNQANKYNEEAVQIKTASTTKEKINQEEIRKQEFAAQAVEVPRAKIDELAHAGIHHYNDALIISNEVDLLTNENNVMQRKLAHTKELYRNFTQANLNN